MEVVGYIVSLLVVICIILCAHYLQQIRDELRQLNNKGDVKKDSVKSHYSR